MTQQAYKPKDEDIIAMLGTLLDTTGVFSLSNDPDHYIRMTRTGEVATTSGADSTQRPLAVYYSADPDAAIINPLSEGNATSQVNSMFYNILNMTIASRIYANMTRVLRVCAASQQKGVDDDKLSEIVSAKIKKYGDKPVSEGDKTTLNATTVMAALRADDTKDLYSMAKVTREEIDSILELVRGVMKDIDDNTVTEFSSFGKSGSSITDFFTMHYNNKTYTCNVSCILTKTNRQKAYPRIRSKSWNVFKTILMRLLGLDDSAEDLSAISYTPKVMEVGVFESYVAMYLELIDRITPHIFVEKFKIDPVKLEEIRTHMKYLKEYHSLAKWCIGTAAKEQPEAPVKNTSGLPTLPTMQPQSPVVTTPVVPTVFTQPVVPTAIPAVQPQPVQGFYPAGQVYPQVQQPVMAGTMAPVGLQQGLVYPSFVQPATQLPVCNQQLIPAGGMPLQMRTTPVAFAEQQQYTKSPDDPFNRR